MRHLELFSGIGGFRRAFDLIGYDLHIPMNCVGFSEIDQNAKKTYIANFHPTKTEVDMGDIVAFTSDEENVRALPDFDLLTGGFPCQTFSMMGNRLGFKDEDRGQMFFRILDVVSLKKPKYILLENVKNLYTHDKGRTFKIIQQELREIGYYVYSDIFNSADFGLAQKRNRVYIFCSREEISSTFEFKSSLISKYLLERIQDTSLLFQKNIFDVLALKVDRMYFLSERIKPTILSDATGGYQAKSEINQIIARPLTASMHKMHRACQDNYYSQNFIESQGIDNPSRYASFEELCKIDIRKLTPHEAFMLQGFPIEWATNAKQEGVADGALFKQAGNAVSVNVVYAILYYLVSFGYIN